MRFICATCNYATDRHSSYQKHLLTQKHKQQMSPTTKQLHSLHKVYLKRAYICNYCGNEYSSISTLSRHKKACNEKESLVTKYDVEIDKYKQENAHLKEMQKQHFEMQKQHIEMQKQQQAEIKRLETLIKNAGGVIKTSVSALAYVAQNYNNAPALKQIKDFSYLENADNDSDNDSDDENDLAQTIIKSHDNKTIVDYLGNIIVQAYKKDDPTKQSIWNSDSTRLTYMIRELIDKKPDWQVDKKGVKTTRYIIAPLLEYIRQLMADFIENNRLENFLHDSDWRMKKRMDNLKSACEICYNIKNKFLSEQLIKHIAPHFYLNKNELLIDG